MQTPFISIREDYCTTCNSERSLECYDSFNNAINYPLLVNMYYNDKEACLKKIMNRSLDYIKCKKCNVIYKIDWSNVDRFPKPLRDHFHISQFIYQNYTK